MSVLLLLGGGLASLAIAAYAGLPFLLALILLGALLGPETLGLAMRGRAVDLLAELGVAFLLFDVGLHLSARSLWPARRYLFAFAPLQIGLCALALAGLFAAAPIGKGPGSALRLGLTLAQGSEFAFVVPVVARALDRAAVPFVAFTSDRERAADARGCGFEVHHADADRPHGLALAASGRASAIVIGVDDDAHGLDLVKQAKRLAPETPIHAVTGRPDLLAEMEAAGARDVVTRGEAVARSLSERLLTDLSVRPRDVEECVAECAQRELQMVGGSVTA